MWRTTDGHKSCGLTFVSEQPRISVLSFFLLHPQACKWHASLLSSGITHSWASGWLSLPAAGTKQALRSQNVRAKWKQHFRTPAQGKTVMHFCFSFSTCYSIKAFTSDTRIYPKQLCSISVHSVLPRKRWKKAQFQKEWLFSITKNKAKLKLKNKYISMLQYYIKQMDR